MLRIYQDQTRILHTVIPDCWVISRNSNTLNETHNNEIHNKANHSPEIVYSKSQKNHYRENVKKIKCIIDLGKTCVLGIKVSFFPVVLYCKESFLHNKSLYNILGSLY